MFLLLYPWSPLNRRLHGPQQEWMFWQRNNFLPLLGTELRLLGYPASSLVSILTILPWLLANNIWTNILLYTTLFPRHLHCYIPYYLKNILNTIWHMRTTSDSTNTNLIYLMSISGVVLTYSLIKLQSVKWEQCNKRLNGILSSLKMTGAEKKYLFHSKRERDRRRTKCFT
jgi:hypothetical protein